MSTVLRGVPAYRARSYAELERIAAGVRKTLGFGETERMHALHLFERLSRLMVRVGDRAVPLCDEVETIHEDVEAVTYYDDAHDTIYVCISEQWYAQLERGHVRANFTVMHELAHGVLHAAELIDRAQLPHAAAGGMRRRGGDPKHPPFMDTEWQANALASALMMPAAAVVEELKGAASQAAAVQALRARFNASAEAASIRTEVVRRHFPNLFRGTA